MSDKTDGRTLEQKIDFLLNEVSTIKRYICSRPDCPQYLWDDVRKQTEEYRQKIYSERGYWP